MRSVGSSYSVYSGHSSFAEAGLLHGLRGDRRRSASRRCSTLVRKQIDSVLEKGITAEELERGKGHLKGGIVLGLEDTGSRDVPARQGRAVPRRDPLARRDARPHRGRDARGRAPLGARRRSARPLGARGRRPGRASETSPIRVVASEP